MSMIVGNTADPSPLLDKKRTASFDVVSIAHDGKEVVQRPFIPEFSYVYVGIAMFAVTLGGFANPLERELQDRSGLPGTLVIAARNMFSLALFSFTVPSNYKAMLRFKYLPLFAILRVLVPLTSVYASRFALSYYVATIYNLTPFVVAAISFVLKDPIPKYTLPAMVMATIGTFLTVAGTALAEGHVSFTTDALVGIAIAFGSCIVDASSFVLYTKFTMDISSKAVFWLSAFCQFIVIAPISFSIDDWTAWKNLDQRGIIEFACYVLGPYLCYDGLQIMATRRIGAPLFATLVPWSGVVALIFGATFLHETAHVLNIIGVVVVAVTVSVYLFLQYRMKVQEDALIRSQEAMQRLQDDEIVESDR